MELAWAPLVKDKKEGKGKVTVKNCFQTAIAVALVDYNGSRRISQQTAQLGEVFELMRTQRAGMRFTFPGSDGHVLYLRAWPAEWDPGDWFEQWTLDLNRDNGRVSFHKSRSWEEAQGLRRFESERLGVSVAYILDQFEEEARCATGQQDPTFHTIAPHFAFGKQGLGKGLECPRDGRSGCSIVDALPAAWRGRATHFLSWAWGYTLSTFVHAIREWISQTDVNPSSTFLWVCFFCNNQFRILEENSQEGSDNLEKAFAGRLTEIGQVVVLFDTWKSAFYLQRAWCVFETFMADKVGANLQIILPSAEARSLEDEIRHGGLGNVICAFREVDIEKARATREVDELRVKELISRTSSFERVNQVVKDRLVQWCKERFSMMMDGEVASPTATPGLVTDTPEVRSPDEALLAENASLRAELLVKDVEITTLRAEKERLMASAVRDKEELATLRGSVGALRLELLQSNGGDDLDGSRRLELCARLERLAAPRPESALPRVLDEEEESLMDSIVGELGPCANTVLDGQQGVSS